MSEEIEPHILEQYLIIKKIGSGAYGHVWKVQDKHTKAIKALKKNFDAFSNSTDAQRTYRQIMFLRQLRHQNIVLLQKTIKAKNDKDIYLVFEHMDVDLHTLIRQNGKTTNLQERHKQYIIHQITKALCYLHHTGLIHRDLKPSNVLINQSCQAKLCDFGLVRFIQDLQQKQTPIMTDYIATRWYRAPQLLLGSNDYNKQIDIWALGCLIAQMFIGKPLFPGTSTLNQLQRVLAWTGNPTSSQLKYLSSNINPVIQQILGSRKKINKNQLLGGKVSPQCMDLISKMLLFDPSKRINIDQVLRHQYLSQFYQEKQHKQLRSGRLKIQLHVNDNVKLSLKQYRDLIYAEISRGKALSPFNSQHRSKHKIQQNKKQQPKKKQISKQKSKIKTIATQYMETRYNTVYNSTQQNKVKRQVKSSIEKSVKSKCESKKKGISVCSKNMNKTQTHSLSKKKKICETEVVQTADLIKMQNRKIRSFNRSCTDKYDRLKKSTQDIQVVRYGDNKLKKLTDFVVNDNIGRKNCHIER